MSKIQKRRLIDAGISLTTLALVWAFAPWWVAVAVAAFGIWSFYDGMTRLNLTRHR